MIRNVFGFVLCRFPSAATTLTTLSPSCGSVFSLTIRSGETLEIRTSPSRATNAGQSCSPKIESPRSRSPSFSLHSFAAQCRSTSFSTASLCAVTFTPSPSTKFFTSSMARYARTFFR